MVPFQLFIYLSLFWYCYNPKKSGLLFALRSIPAKYHVHEKHKSRLKNSLKSDVVLYCRFSWWGQGRKNHMVQHTPSHLGAPRYHCFFTNSHFFFFFKSVPCLSQFSIPHLCLCVSACYSISLPSPSLSASLIVQTHAGPSLQTTSIQLFLVEKFGLFSVSAILHSFTIYPSHTTKASSHPLSSQYRQWILSLLERWWGSIEN